MSAVWTWLKENADRSRTDWFSELGFETALTVAIDFLPDCIVRGNNWSNEQLSHRLPDLEYGEKGSITTHFHIKVQRKWERAATKPSNVSTQKLWNDAKQYNTAKRKVFNLIKLWLSQTSHWPLCCLSCLGGFAGSVWVAGGVWGCTLTFWPTFLPTIPGAGGVFGRYLRLGTCWLPCSNGHPPGNSHWLGTLHHPGNSSYQHSRFLSGERRLLLEMDTCCSW